MRQIIKGLAVTLLFCLPHALLGVGSNVTGDTISERNNYKEVIANADLYYQLKNTPKAIEILQRELEVCKDPSLKSYLNYKIGLAYLDDGQLDMALNHLNKFKNYQENNGDSLGIVKADIALGKYYYKLKDYSNASSLLFQALNAMSHNDDNELNAKAFIVLAEVNLQTESFSDAKKYAQKALSIASNLNSGELKVTCCNVFSRLYERMGDYQSALYYKNKSIQFQDSILKSKVASLGIMQHSSKMNAVVKNETTENIVRSNPSINTLGIDINSRGALYVISISLLFAFALVFFILFRSKVQLSRKLKSKNIELEKLNATKDKFFSIIAHDLKSPFNSLMGFSEVLSLQVESKSQKEIMDYSRSIHNSTRKLYSLVETLLQWSRTQLGTTEYKPEKIDVKILASNIVSILKINAEEKDIVISIDIDNELIAWADKDLFSAVLRNLVSNAIKFSRVGSVIGVSGKAKGSNIEISVTDTGVGISKENLEKIFRVDTNLSTLGTLNEKGTGLGLVLCKEFVEINKGVINAESKLEKGSTFKFTVPLSSSYSLN